MTNIGSSGIFIPSYSNDIKNPTNIMGYYKIAIREFLSDMKNKDSSFGEATVVPAYNENVYKTHSIPVIVIQKGGIRPSLEGINGGKEQLHNDVPLGIPSDSYSPRDSSSYTSIDSMNLRVGIYGGSSAEVDRIAYAVYSLLKALSHDVLQDLDSCIVRVEPPELSGVSVAEKYTDKFYAEINWSIQFQVSSIILSPQKFIRLIKLEVSENDSSNTIVLNP